MHSDLAAEQTVGELPGDTEGSRLDARLFARLMIVQHGLEAVTLAPAQVHAHQHFGPVLRFGAAGAGMDGHDGVVAVGIARKQRLGFQALDGFAQGIQLALQLFVHALAFAGEFEVGGDVLGTTRQIAVG